MHIEVTQDSFRLAQVFRISRGARTKADVLTVRVTDAGITGIGECVPYARYGESLESVEEEIRGFSGTTRMELAEALPAGAARNALDCALWDLEAKKAGVRVWDLAGLAEPGPLTSAYTLSLDEPDAMESSARTHAWRPLLKVKLGTADDMHRIEAVRRGAPESAIIVDANEGWSAEVYSDLAPHLVRLGVKLVEQPLPAGDDDALLGLARPLPICADESAHDRACLPGLKGKYDVVNIKLDKTGGLTEALALKSAALAENYDLMIGCMVGTSLAMAPAVLVGQGASFVDLDGPLLLAEDRPVPLEFEGSLVHPPLPGLWG